MVCAYLWPRSCLRFNGRYGDPFASTSEQPLPLFHILPIHRKQLSTRTPCS
jgi:hypothetical protein